MFFKLFIWTFMFVVFCLFNLITSNQAQPSNYGRICPLPTCSQCPSNEEIKAPGIGFALETSYGAAVVRFHNGTYQQIALIEADKSYKYFLRNLATGPKSRTPDHFDTNWEKLQYLKSRTQRLINKVRGLPATPEIGILASMVSKLLNQTSIVLGAEIPIVAAVLTSPHRISLNLEETDDLFVYLGLKNLMSVPDSLEDLYSTSASYAGYGRGLCKLFTDVISCELEESYFSIQRVLYIDFNRNSLSRTIKRLQSAQDGFVEATFIDFDLGYEREEVLLDLVPENRRDIYWDAVSTRIREFVVGFESKITELLFTGTAASDAKFRTVIKITLYGVVGEDFCRRFIPIHIDVIGMLWE
ncbi:hypothetical protein ACHAPG_011362 [Botrytis cinerea]